jgi:hypothetical protein
MAQKLTVEEILRGDNEKLKKSLFLFNRDDGNEVILFKFGIWSRYFFPKYFKSDDAPFHKDMDEGNLDAYLGNIHQFVDIAFRGAAKTARTKLFIAFCICNDKDHHRRYIRCLSADLENAKQSVTDIYNMVVRKRVKEMYPEVLQKTDVKREETMGSFTTSTGVKVVSKQIGVDQRGKIMEDAKSDFDWYDDFETKTTIRSAVTSHKIGENMEEARTGLALGGSSIYTANYFSEMGNVHQLVKKIVEGKRVLIIPIEDEKRNPTWDRYTKKDIQFMRQTDEDFEGERLCKPNAAKDIYFAREQLDAMPRLVPIREIGEFKIFRPYKADHRYASGHDVAGGVGLDSSSTVIIDFDTIPAQVVATYASNTILPEAFGTAILDHTDKFGGCLAAVENNKFDSAILKAKQLKVDLFKTQPKVTKIGYAPPTTYGWNTNSLTKSKMFSGLKKAVEDGLIELNDENLINEAESYTRNDLIDNDPDVRLTTRHFDLLIACCIAWQMKDYAKAKRKIEENSGGSIWNKKQEVNPAE